MIETVIVQHKNGEIIENILTNLRKFPTRNGGDFGAILESAATRRFLSSLEVTEILLQKGFSEEKINSIVADWLNSADLTWRSLSGTVFQTQLNFIQFLFFKMFTSLILHAFLEPIKAWLSPKFI